MEIVYGHSQLALQVLKFKIRPLMDGNTISIIAPLNAKFKIRPLMDGNDGKKNTGTAFVEDL